MWSKTAKIFVPVLLRFWLGNFGESFIRALFFYISLYITSLSQPICQRLHSVAITYKQHVSNPPTNFEADFLLNRPSSSSSFLPKHRPRPSDNTAEMLCREERSQGVHSQRSFERSSRRGIGVKPQGLRVG